MSVLPALFVSHGAPDLPLRQGSPAGQFLLELGQRWPRPQAILVISAHWQSPVPLVSAAAHPPTIHDFSGFPPQLYQLHYPAAGSPEVAERVVALGQAANLPIRIHPHRGLDHGAWTPLMLLYPAADIPVTQLSIQGDRDPQYHLTLGQALAPLRQEGVLILGSGSVTHNLAAWHSHAQGDPPLWVTAFDQWIADQVAASNWSALVDFQRQAPYAAQNHPTIEHLLPLFVTLGAAGSLENGAVQGERLHHSFSDGVLSMAAFAFEGASRAVALDLDGTGSQR